MTTEILNFLTWLRDKKKIVLCRALGESFFDEYVPLCVAFENLLKEYSQPSMGNAKSTLESSIISGLSKHANLTGASIEHAHIQVLDILEAIFHPSVRWSIKEYLRELEQ